MGLDETLLGFSQEDAQKTAVANTLELASQYKPDQMATYNRLAKQTQLDPLQMAEDPALLEAAKKRAYAQDLNIDQLVQTHPYTTRMLQNVGTASLIQDDVAEMSALESALNYYMRFSAATVSSVPAVAAGSIGLMRMTNDVFLKPYTRAAANLLGTRDPGEIMSRYLKRQQEFAQSGVDALMGRAMAGVTSDSEAGAYSGAQSLGIMLLSGFGGAAVAKRVEQIGSRALGIMVGQVGGTEYQTAIDAGKSPLEAAMYAGGQASVEYITEVGPTAALFKGVKVGAPMFKKMLQNSGQFIYKEVLGEQVATAWQDLNSWAVLNPEKTFKDYLADRPSAAVQTLVATLVAGGGVLATTKTLQLLTEQDTRAENAQKAYGNLQAVMQATAAAQLKERGPEQLELFMQTMADDGGSTDIYLDAAELSAAMQQAPEEERARILTAMPELAGSVAEGSALAGDVVVPFSTFATYFSGTSVGEAVLQHAKTSPDSFTFAQAQEYYAQQADIMQQAADQLSTEEAQTEEYAADVQQVYQSTLDQLTATGRYSKPAAEKMAELRKAWYVTRAASLGIKPSELYAQFPSTVTELAGLPEAAGYEQFAPEAQALLRAADEEDRMAAKRARIGDAELAEQHKARAAELRAQAQAAQQGAEQTVAPGVEVDEQGNVRTNWAVDRFDVHTLYHPNGHPLHFVSYDTMSRYASTYGFRLADKPVRRAKPVGSSQYGYRRRENLRIATPGDVTPKRIKNLLRTNKWAILTAENPGAEQLSPEENSERNEALKRILGTRGIAYIEVKGKYGGNEENSIMLFNVSRDEASQIGQMFGQESVLTRDGLVYPDGTVNVARGVTTFDKAPEDFYTRVPSTGAAFSVDIDFDNRVPLGEAGRVGEVRIDGVHFSTIRRPVLSGRAYGTGLMGEERNILMQPGVDARLKNRIYFYVDEGNGVTPEAGVGSVRHEATLTNLYDGASNPLKFPSGDTVAFETAVLNAGFDGYYVKGVFGTQGAAVLFGPAADSLEVDLPPEGALFQITGTWTPQIETPEFQSWFEGSRVVGANGMPLIVYHGSTMGGIKHSDSRVTFFTDSRELAEDYAVPYKPYKKDAQPTVQGVYLKMVNPLVIDVAGDSWAEIPYLGRIYDSDTIAEVARGQGHDGLILRNVLDNITGKYREPSDVYVTLGKTGQIKSATDNIGTFNPKNPNIYYQEDELPEQVKTDAFKKWSKGYPLISMEESQDLDFKSGEPVVLASIHGTTGDFTTFSKAFASVEGNLGAGFYSTNSYEDASSNYSGEGPDFQAKLERLTEKYLSDMEGSDWADNRTAEEVRAEAERLARSEMAAEHEGLSMPLYVRMDNPAVIGGSGTTWLDFYMDYDEETGEEYGEPTGGLVAFIEAAHEAIDEQVASEQDAQKLHESLNGYMGVAPRGEFALEEIKRVFFESEEMSYYAFNEEGDFVVYEIFRAALEKLGFDGIIDQNVASRFKMNGLHPGSRHYVAFSPKQIKSALGNKGTFDPNNADILHQGDRKTRGFFDPASFTTGVLADADLSTYLHETGHFFLEADARLAARSDAPQELKDNFLKALNWMGVKDLATWQSMSLEQKRPHHEKFARGFEAYLMEGKAPSLELKSIFRTFATWLTHIYRSLRNLNVELTDEVREVFDRMLASEEAIDAAERARGYEALLLGDLTDEAAQEYVDAGDQATREAIEDLQRRSLRDMRWVSNARSEAIKALQRSAKQARRAVKAEVTDEAMAEPVNQARTFLTKGEYRDEAGDVVKAEGKAKLDASIAKGILATMPTLNADELAPLMSSTGLHPDAVADMFGFSSGTELIYELLTSEKAHEKIEGITDQRMLERFGDLYDDRAIAAAADDAIHNEARAKFMATGLKMAMKSVIPAAQLKRAAKNAAQQAIGNKKVSQINPAVYLAAETKANREALKAAATEPEKAQRAQRAALLNNQMARAAMDAKEEVAKSLARMKKLQRKGAQGAMRGDYLDQLNALLERFDLRTSAAEMPKERAELRAWLASKGEELDAVAPDVPEWVLNEATRRSYKSLTLAEFRGLNDAVRALELLARREEKQYQAIRGMAFREERGAILERIRQFHPEAFASDGVPLRQMPKGVPTFSLKVGKLADKAAAEFLNAENIINLLEGGEFGQVNESLFGRLSKRADWKASRLEEIHNKLKPLLGAYSYSERRAFGSEDITTPAGLTKEIGFSMSRENALVVALLHGSEDGRDRLGNYGLSEDTITKVIDLLDERDIALANGIWSLFDNDLWPELEALNKRTRGKAPPKIVAVPHKAKNGSLTGGYYRLKYDGELDERATHYDEMEGVKALMGGTLGRSAKTAQGTSAERVGSSMRPRLDLGVMADTISETVHDLAYREAVLDTIRLLNDNGIQDAIKTVVGNSGYHALVTRVREVASSPRNPSGFIEHAAALARKNSIVTLMSGISTALLNTTGLLPALTRVNALRLAAAVASPRKTAQYKHMIELSEYMRHRSQSYERDLQDGLKKLTVDKAFIPMPDTGTFLYFMAQTDKAITTPVWTAAMQDGMEKFGNDTEKAVEYADHIVRQTQGTGRAVDVAAIMSGHGGWGHVKKLFTMFYSYFNSQLGLLVRSGAVNARLAKTNPVLASARFTKDFLLIVALPAILTEAIRGNIGGGDDDPEKMAGELAWAVASFGLAMFPLIRDMAPMYATIVAEDSVKFYGYKATPAQFFVEGPVKAIRSVIDYAEGEGDDKDLRDIIMGTSVAVGAPGKLISDTVTGTKAFMEGEAGPQAIVVGPPKKP